MGQNVTLYVDPRRDLDELHSFGRTAQHAPFRHIEYGLTRLAGVAAAERYLLHSVHELAAAAFLDDTELPVLHPDLQPACGEGSGEHQFARVLADVDEAAC